MRFLSIGSEDLLERVRRGRLPGGPLLPVGGAGLPRAAAARAAGGPAEPPRPPPRRPRRALRPPGRGAHRTRPRLDAAPPLAGQPPAAQERPRARADPGATKARRSTRSRRRAATPHRGPLSRSRPTRSAAPSPTPGVTRAKRRASSGSAARPCGRSGSATECLRGAGRAAAGVAAGGRPCPGAPRGAARPRREGRQPGRPPGRPRPRHRGPAGRRTGRPGGAGRRLRDGGGHDGGREPGRQVAEQRVRGRLDRQGEEGSAGEVGFPHRLRPPGRLDASRRRPSSGVAVSRSSEDRARAARAPRPTSTSTARSAATSAGSPQPRSRTATTLGWYATARETQSESASRWSRRARLARRSVPRRQGRRRAARGRAAGPRQPWPCERLPLLLAGVPRASRLRLGTLPTALVGHVPVRLRRCRPPGGIAACWRRPIVLALAFLLFRGRVFRLMSLLLSGPVLGSAALPVFPIGLDDRLEPAQPPRSSADSSGSGSGTPEGRRSTAGRTACGRRSARAPAPPSCPRGWPEPSSPEAPSGTGRTRLDHVPPSCSARQRQR